MVYDTAIIGTGPAGISAAINLRIHNKEIIWFGSRDMSQKVGKSELIRNYPGLPSITGSDLNNRLMEHAASMDLEITDKMVSQIMYSRRSGFTLLAENEMYKARTVILAMGVMTQKVLPGEEDKVGSGVSYCATCDGFLYKGKEIAVLCTDRRFCHEIEYLAELAEKVYLFTTIKDYVPGRENIKVMEEKIKEVEGEGKLRSLALSDGSSLPVSALFCLRSSIAPTTLLPGLCVEEGLITVDRRMETNIPGCYAAGDSTGAPYQIAKAVGEGNIAAHSAIRKLSELNAK